jgi:hypothetical protein
MTNFKKFTKLTDRRPAIVSCLLGNGLGSGLGSALPGTGLSGVSGVRLSSLAVLPISERDERPTQAPAAVATAQASAYAFAAIANGAGSETKRQTMWSFRGLEPWSDPA